MNDVALHKGKLVVAADTGVFVSSDNGATWSRLGTNLPDVVVSQLTIDPTGTLVAATHGRGVWTIAAP
jgi:ligand-binding sensor domain-containing protein